MTTKIIKCAVHWHGASHGSLMRHIALVPEYDKDKTEWLQAVSDEEYNNFKVPVFDVKSNLTTAAIRNHSTLWPDYISQAKATNPG